MGRLMLVCAAALPTGILKTHFCGEGNFNMKSRFSALCAAGAILVVMFAATSAASAQTKTPNMPKVGDKAPDFSLKYFDGHELKDVKLSDYTGKKNVVLAFYVFAFTGG